VRCDPHGVAAGVVAFARRPVLSERRNIVIVADGPTAAHKADLHWAARHADCVFNSAAAGYVVAGARNGYSAAPMCGRFVQHDLAAFERYFKIRRSPGWRPSFNVAPSQSVAIARHDAGSGAVVLAAAGWGFVPAWVTDPAKWPKPINGRVETLFEKPTWRTAIRRTRCLVPASGWYEWQAVDGRKQPYYFQPTAPVALGGVWERSGTGDEAVDTFAVLVGAAPSTLKTVHDRAPIALTEDVWSAWLDPTITERSEIEALLAREAPPVRYWAVSTRVNRPHNNDPELVTPIT